MKDEPLSSFAREVLEEFITPASSQIHPLHFRPHLSTSDIAMPDLGVSSLAHQEETSDPATVEFQETERQISAENTFTGRDLPFLNIKVGINPN